MTLIECPECGNEVSTEAVACPHCGAPPPGQETKRPEQGWVRGFHELSGWWVAGTYLLLTAFYASGIFIYVAQGGGGPAWVAGVTSAVSWVFFVALYLLPSVIAWKRIHHRRSWITVVNLVFGWTVLGWFVALIWSETAPLPDESTGKWGKVSIAATVLVMFAVVGGFAMETYQAYQASRALSEIEDFSESLRNNSSPSRNGSSIAVRSQVEIESWNWRTDPSFGVDGAVIWTVKIANNSSQYLEDVQVEITTEDGNGQVVTSSRAYVESIAPGGSGSNTSYADYYGTEETARIRIVDVDT